jgi:hypothetical protein
MNVHDFKAGGPNPILCNYQALDGEVCCLGKGEHAEQLAEVLRIRAEQDQVARGRLAFEAYDKDRGGVNYQGLPTPKWDDLTPGIRHGWVVGAAAVREQVLRELHAAGALRPEIDPKGGPPVPPLAAAPALSGAEAKTDPLLTIPAAAK